jgi:hypothetical protein
MKRRTYAREVRRTKHAMTEQTEKGFAGTRDYLWKVYKFASRVSVGKHLANANQANIQKY